VVQTTVGWKMGRTYRLVLERILSCWSRGGGARSTGSLGVQDGGRWWICCGEEWVEGLGQSVEQLDVGCAGDMGVNSCSGILQSIE
jgi:hypothetical protein